MKSETEEFCKSKFDAFVRTELNHGQIQWVDVAQRDEPPDYFLYLDGTKYAVEVTTLLEKKDVGNLRLPTIAIIDSLWQLVDEVERSARDDSSLHGAYVVKFTRPIADLRSNRDQLFRNLLTYVKATQDAEAASEEVVYEANNRKCTITKLHNQRNYIGKIGPVNGKWEGDVLNEICVLLKERIDSKSHKLRNIVEPQILLLYDAYHFADAEMYKNCLTQITSLTSFHTVFVAQPNNDGFTLFSINPRWL